MSLDMAGHIDPVFESIAATRTSRTGGGYDSNGDYQPPTESTTTHVVNIQPATDREIETLEKGGERIVDARVIHVNDGIDASIQKSDIWEFEGQSWKCHALDNRYWRSYCRAVVSRIDS